MPSVTCVTLPEASEYTWTSFDGVEIQGLLYRPRDDANGALPRVVYVRGRRGKKVKKVVRPPELAPPPKGVSLIGRVDWARGPPESESRTRLRARPATY